MPKFIHSFFIAMLIFGGASAAVAQSTAPTEKPATASISGRVMINGRPARNVAIIAVLDESDSRKSLQRMMEGFAGVLFRAKTDEEGQYRIENLVAGRYDIAIMAPSLVAAPVEPAAKPNSVSAQNDVEDEDEDDDDADDEPTVPQVSYSDTSKRIKLAEGETVKDINFSARRGGVITGRVTDADGKPVIGETVMVSRVQGSGYSNGRNNFFSFGDNNFTTDDRGIYRVYGVEPGSYKVSVTFRPTGFMNVATTRQSIKTTYYPGVTDDKVATPVEVLDGGEVRGIDIKLGVSNTFTASGRVVEAETGKPVPNFFVAYSGSGTAFGKAKSPTNTRGEFKIDGLPTGTYRLATVQDVLGQSDFYADSLPLEIKEADINGLELKLHRGLTISGVAVIEGSQEAALMTKLTQQMLLAISSANTVPASEGAALPGYSQAKIGADGSFTFRGVRPGKVGIGMYDITGASGLTMARIERGGVEQKGEIDIRQGESIADVRLVFAQANGVIRGTVQVEDLSRLKDFELTVRAKRTNAGNSGMMNFPGISGAESEEVDASGHFVIEGLIAGEYELTLTARQIPKSFDGPPLTKTVQQIVLVTPDRESTVVLTIDLKVKSDK